MRINNNVMAMNTHRQLGINTAAGAKSLEKLSSGYRINRAGDDAAGLAISEKMRGQIRGLNMASRNAQDGISLIQTAEGALAETHNMLQRMRELAVQANNGTNTEDDLAELQKEIDQLNEEITRIAEKTEFNTKTLLDGSLGVRAKAEYDEDGGPDNLVAKLQAEGVIIDVYGVKEGTEFEFAFEDEDNTLTVTVEGVEGLTQTIDVSGVEKGDVIDFTAFGIKFTLTDDVAFDELFDGNFDTITTEGTQTKFQIGPNKDTLLNIGIEDMRAEALGSDIVDVAKGEFDTNIDAIDDAVAKVSSQRAQLGAWQNRLEYTIKNLDASSENLQASEARIRDLDMAEEMMEFTKNNILQQAATAMLAQANMMPQSVLQLLG